MAGHIDGYEAEPAEVEAVLAGLVGEREPDDGDEQWFAYLSSRLVLFTAVTKRISALRDDLVAGMVARSSERTVAAVLGLSPARPGQMARRARASK